MQPEHPASLPTCISRQFVQPTSCHERHSIVKTFVRGSLQFPCLFDDVDGCVGPANRIGRVRHGGKSVLSLLREYLGPPLRYNAGQSLLGMAIKV